MMGSFIGWAIGSILAFIVIFSIDGIPGWATFLIAFMFATAGIHIVEKPKDMN